jgi:hypothetical protein
MKAVIVSPPKQMGLAKKLSQWCRNLDGTEIEIIEKFDGEDDEIRKIYPPEKYNTEVCTRTYCLRKAAIAFKKQPFFWLEPDSIPLKRGWLKTIEDEYVGLGKPYLLSSDSNPPHDLIGGIGVYGPDTYWQIPVAFTNIKWSWDLWMIKQIPNLVARTNLIQHSYGLYDSQGIACPHRFPRDENIIRNGSVVFHRDSKQDLIKSMNKNVFVHSGHCGDLIAAMPVFREMGGGKVIITQTPFTAQHNPMKGVLYESVRPLIEFQPYIDSVSWQDEPSDYTHDLREFRSHYGPQKTLTQAQSDFLREPFNYSPWLSAPINADIKGDIAVSRSPRYHNPFFPWRRILKRNSHRMVFLGTEKEHRDFISEFGFPIHHHKTKNLLDVASAIQSSKLFIGNQSSPCWIAMGLGHPLIQETHQNINDSIIYRKNSMFVADGNMAGCESLGLLL